MKNALETYKYKGFYIHVLSDEDPMNPRKDFDPAGTMVCWHRLYELGDEQPSEDPEEYMASLLAETDDSWILEKHERDVIGLDNNCHLTGKEWKAAWDAMNKAYYNRVMDSLDKHYIILKLYLYDHSGITMSCSSFQGRAQHAEWDSGPVGYIYISKKKAIEEWGSKREKLTGIITQETEDKATKYMEGEVEEYDNYLTGQVYGYVISTDKGGKEQIEDGSVWGYFGYENTREDGYMVKDAKSTIDHHIKWAIKQHGKQVKTWIKNHVPLIYREPLVLA